MSSVEVSWLLLTARFNGGRQKEWPDCRGHMKCTASICCRVEFSAPALPLDFTSAVHSRTRREITLHEWHSEAPKAPNNDFQNPPASLSRRQIISSAHASLSHMPHHRGIPAPGPCRCLAAMRRPTARKGRTPYSCNLWFTSTSFTLCEFPSESTLCYYVLYIYMHIVPIWTQAHVNKAFNLPPDE